MKLAIVDDMENDRERLRARVEAYAAERGHDWQVVCFPGGEELLAAAAPGEFGAVFLDVVMNGLNGLETAARLRAIDPRAALVFVTAEADYAVDGYEVEAAGFLVKGVAGNAARFERLMERLERRLDPEPMLQLPGGEGPARVPLSGILYIEILDHQMQVHTDLGCRSLRMTLGEIRPRLDQRFFECHRGVLINLDRIRSLDGAVVTLESGDVLPVSRRRRAPLGEAFAARSFERLREDG